MSQKQTSSFEVVKGTPAGIKPKKFAVRAATASAYAIFNLVVFIIGMDYFVLPLVTALFAGIGAWEYYQIVGSKMNRSLKISGMILAISLPLVTSIARTLGLAHSGIVQGALSGFTGLFYAISIALGVYMIWVALTPTSHIKDAAQSFFGALYLGIPLSFLLLIRDFEEGLALSLGLLISVWALDSLAYLFGSLFGRHKLAPLISPKKSWEGFMAGTAGSILVWLILPRFTQLDYPWYAALIMGVLIAVAALLGDLFESRLKREHGVKDSGDLLPGHGGILDRIDSMLSTSLFMFLLLSTVGTLLKFIAK